MVIHAKEVSALDQLKDKIKAELAQTTLTAYVVDELGKPMAGVNVHQKDAPGNATITDTKGRFSITVPNDQTILVFSYIGYETQELAVKYIPSGSDVKMKVAENNLQEVVINKGYYDEKREYLTGDVSVVSAKIIEQQPVTDPMLALEGQVAGLNITQASGIPGAYEKDQHYGPKQYRQRQ